MKKLTQCRLPIENLLLPYYLSDTNFTSVQDYLGDFELQTDDQQTEIFTTLNIPPEQFYTLEANCIRIPVYGWAKQADYFFSDGFFDTCQHRLLDLMKALPKVRIILEYQLNCFSIEGLWTFMDKLLEFRSKHPHPGRIELDFGLRQIPSYLDIILNDNWKTWLQACIDEMKFDRRDISRLQTVAIKIESNIEIKNYGNNARKQLYCTLYYAILTRGTKSQTSNSFPQCLPLLKKAAVAFLEINPKIKENGPDQKDEILRKYKTDLEEKTLTFSDTLKENFLSRFLKVKDHVLCEHSDLEMLEVASEILNLPKHKMGVVVEAGIFKGGGTSKLSLACSIRGINLFAFDSFQGLPSHEEASENVLYPPGVYFGSKGEVQRNLEQYGAPEVTTLVEGWFDDTLPKFHEPVAIAYLDVDLVSSTTVCLRYLWPQLIKGGMIFCHDGHLPEVAKLIYDPEFWRREFDEPLPQITHVLGKIGFIKITKR